MTDDGIPELGLSAARGTELMLINRVLLKKSLSLWEYILELEKTDGVTEREKLTMTIGTAYSVALSSKDTQIRVFNTMRVQGLS